MALPPTAAPPGEREPSTFRSDLEGLRAVAVALVLLYHARVPGFNGGYVGVDVFFVLSGFLITGLLLRELRSTGRISFRAFYARRARRLLPAAAVVLVFTAIASPVMLPPLRVPGVEADVTAAALYVSNIWFALQATDYLAANLPPSPVLHFWSLGVEEQFYVFWPALLALVAGAAFAGGRVAHGVRRVGVTLVVVFATSLVASVWLTGVQQPWAFFSLPTRAWELALGGLLALPIAATLVNRRIAPALGWTGLALVIASGLLLDESTPFPGVAALLPTVGSAMVIASGLAVATDAATRAGSRIPGPAPILALPPVRYIGRISYSLYLWHWPLLVLPAAVLGPLPAPARIVLVALAIGMAAMSQRWVEEPIRHGRFVGLRPKRVLAFAGATTIVLAGFSLTLGMMSTTRVVPTGPVVGGGVDEVPGVAVAPASPIPAPGVEGPIVTPLAVLEATPVPADLAPTLASARDDNPRIYGDGCHLEHVVVAIGECAYGDPTSATTIVLFGDSHAAQWFPTLERIARERGWRLVSLTKSACASIDVPVWSGSLNRAYTECDQWRAAAEERIRKERPATVVVSNSRVYQLAIDGAPSPVARHENLWAEGQRRTLERLAGMADSVTLVGDTVRMREDPPVCLSDHLDNAAACATPWDEAVPVKRLVADATIAEETGARFIDPTPWMCRTDPCPAVIGRLLVFRDEHHMTATFARALAKPFAQAAGLDATAGVP
jgi:peptidoglycan/LPS O-acetylase OafA/YrhL